MTCPTQLRVEHLDEPLGITERRPRLSWLLPDGVSVQHAYRIKTDDWDSGYVESDQSVLVPYAGRPLRAGERTHWTVKVWTDCGESDWADPAWWEMGLLDPDDWMARWVEPSSATVAHGDEPGPGHLLRGSFVLDGTVAEARLYVTAHGLYEFFVNGFRVGDMELTPGCTSYWSNLQVQTFDVTHLLQQGEVALGAVVTSGWFSGQVGGMRMAELFGDTVGLLAQLEVRGSDGAVLRVGTGSDWVATVGAIRAADLMEGQTVDYRRDIPSWCTPAADLRGWSPVTVRDYDLKRLKSSPAPPVRRVAELTAVSVTRPAEDRQVVDFGQNFSGWIRLGDVGPGNTHLTLTYGEALGEDSDLTLDNLVPTNTHPTLDRPEFANLKRPFQVDHVTSAGDSQAAFEPRHTTHGFRYVRIQGHPHELTPADVAGIVVHTDLRRTGWFECSDERINRLHEAAVWSFRGNACDIPTDCPHRERAGFTGDWQIFLPSASFLFDVAGFSTKWLRDLAAEQKPSGVVFDCAPNPYPDEVYDRLGVQHGSAGWGDAAVIVPWEVYQSYGDRELLAEQWPSMAAWVEYAADSARRRRHPSRVAARPTPAPHERYIWDTGFHWGEWLEPGEGEVDLDGIAARANADHGIVATAFLHHSSRILARVAEVIGREADATRYDELAKATHAAWQAEFIDTDGMLAQDTQANHVRALAFNLAPPRLRRQLAARLVELIRRADMHLGTGFLSTPHLLPVLADEGYLDIAYRLLLQDSEPAWLSMIDRGATTIWEAWNGVDCHGRAQLSLNHYSKGAVVAFLHRYVAGIQPIASSPGYRRFRIAPRPGGEITWARAAYDSPYGRIESSWKVDRTSFNLEITVPPGTSADVLLPDGQRRVAAPGTVIYRCPLVA